jgi:Mg-chelatase subunit ChlD
MASDVQTEPSKNDLRAVVPAGKPREPVFLGDGSGSMDEPAAPGSRIKRRSVVGEAVKGVVQALEGQDSQAAREAAAGEDAGGVMAYIFSDEGAAVCLDDLSSENVDEKWSQIEWGGQTYIMDGWRMVVDGFKEEFGDQPVEERPALLVVIITDGEANDYEKFAREMSQLDRGEVYVIMAVIGYGTYHDRALRAYQEIDAKVKHFRVVTFGSVVDAEAISRDLLSLIGSDA